MKDMFKRVFSRKAPANVTKSIRCPQEMWVAVEALANEIGESPNSFIVLVLDQYLQVQIENGNLKPPGTSPEKSAS